MAEPGGAGSISHGSVDWPGSAGSLSHGLFHVDVVDRVWDLGLPDWAGHPTALLTVLDSSWAGWSTPFLCLLHMVWASQSKLRVAQFQGGGSQGHVFQEARWKLRGIVTSSSPTVLLPPPSTGQRVTGPALLQGGWEAACGTEDVILAPSGKHDGQPPPLLTDENICTKARLLLQYPLLLRLSVIPWGVRGTSALQRQADRDKMNQCLSFHWVTTLSQAHSFTKSTAELQA